MFIYKYIQGIKLAKKTTGPSTNTDCWESPETNHRSFSISADWSRPYTWIAYVYMQALLWHTDRHIHPNNIAGRILYKKTLSISCNKLHPSRKIWCEWSKKHCLETENYVFQSKCPWYNFAVITWPCAHLIWVRINCLPLLIYIRDQFRP